MKNKSKKNTLLCFLFIILAISTSLTIYFITKKQNNTILPEDDLSIFLKIVFPLEQNAGTNYQASSLHDYLYFIDVIYNPNPNIAKIYFETLTIYTVKINFLFFNYTSGIPNFIASDINISFNNDYVYERILDFNFDFLQLQIKVIVE